MPITEGMTPYRYWGDLPVWIVVLLSILLVWRGQSKGVIRLKILIKSPVSPYVMLYLSIARRQVVRLLPGL